MSQNFNGEMPVVDCSGDVDRTKQSMKEECDVNKIVARFEVTGMMNHLQRRQPVYADVSSVGDYHEALQRVDEARRSFMTLPAKVRLHFGNDPAAFLEYMTEPGRTLQDLRELGLGLVDERRVRVARTRAADAATPPPAGAGGGV